MLAIQRVGDSQIFRLLRTHPLKSDISWESVTTKSTEFGAIRRFLKEAVGKQEDLCRINMNHTNFGWKVRDQRRIVGGHEILTKFGGPLDWTSKYELISPRGGYSGYNGRYMDIASHRMGAQSAEPWRISPILARLLSMQGLILLGSLFLPTLAFSQSLEGSSSRSIRKEAVRSIPFKGMNPRAMNVVREVVENPTYFRRMPQQVIECDPNLFLFMVRRPEVMVNIWQIMGITKVSAQRISNYAFYANDGAGTTCKCDLAYATKDLHVYVGDGAYDGSMTPRKVTGKCVCILRSTTAAGPGGEPVVRGTMDVFLKLDNLGADLIARSLSPFVNKTADYNFVETAKFISEISRVCQRSPVGVQSLAQKLNTVDPSVQREFAMIAANSATKARGAKFDGFSAQPAHESQLMTQQPRAVPNSAIPSNDPATFHLSDAKTSTSQPPMGLQSGTHNSSGYSPNGNSQHDFVGPSGGSRRVITPRKPQLYMRR